MPSHRFLPVVLLSGLGVLSACSHADTPAGEKIPLLPAMLTNESAKADVTMLVDEQELAGDPRGGKAGKPQTSWNAGWAAKEMNYPLCAILDLGRSYKLSDIYFFDGAGAGEVTVEHGLPFQWKPLFVDSLKNYDAWNRHAIDVSTRYLHLTMADPGVSMPELVIYGTPDGPVPAPVRRAASAAKPRPLPTMDQFLGTNAFIDDPIDKIQAIGFLREYHVWGWDAADNEPGAKPYPNNTFGVNPSPAAGGNLWFFDDYYAKLKAAGVTVSPCIQGNVTWLSGDPKGWSWKPIAPGANPTDPASYAAHADHMFQYAARYGSVKVPDKILKLRPNQPRKSGLGLLQYYENWNEPDKTWEGRQAYSTPYELAAQCSADYDGHQKKMGTTLGVKNADPNAKMAIGGLCTTEVDYIKAMKTWADWNRGGDFPADVINVHHYCNDTNGQGYPNHGVSPEDGKLKEIAAKLVAYRNSDLPKCEVWMTEFGYDTNAGSSQKVPPIGDTSMEETQANWIIRSYLALAAAKVDRACQYMLRDVNVNSPTQYDNSGLVGEKGKWGPKASWYYTYTLKNRLTGMRFAGEVPSGDPKVLVYKFRSDEGNGAYVLWCPTSNNSTVPDFELAKLAPAKSATLVELTKGETSGKASPLALTNGAVTVAVSEKPVIVMVDAVL